MSKKDLIANEILQMIKQGAVGPGDKLPSIRTLAQQYKVSITPVTDAYDDLVSLHWVENRPHSGYYVSCTLQNDFQTAEYERQIHLNVSERYGMVDHFISGYSHIAFNVNNDIYYAFGSTATSASLYPCSNFNMYYAHSLRHLKVEGNFQTRPHDESALKKEIMKWMIPCKCENVIEDISIVPSVSEAILLSLRACAKPGSVVALEAPGHAGFYFNAKFLDYQIVPVPSRPSSGLDVDAFAAMLKNGVHPACLLLCSNFSNPTGALMSDINKQRLTHLCAKYGIPIIEDDILGDLHFTESRPRPLKSFDSDNVIYISGFGKSLYPVARLGYISAGRYKDAVSFYKHLATAYASPLLQTAIADFFHHGLAQKYVSFFRKRLNGIVESYYNLIKEHFPPNTEVALPSGGIYLWITLPDGMDADTLCVKARPFGISIAPGRLFNAPLKKNTSFRLNCAAVVWNQGSQEAVKKLGELACAMTRE